MIRLLRLKKCRLVRLPLTFPLPKLFTAQLNIADVCRAFAEDVSSDTGPDEEEVVALVMSCGVASRVACRCKAGIRLTPVFMNGFRY